ncbi:MAG: MerR family transcriptional regulator [bacterium]|nr:MerR family transcriptional regulator [bacterium]
MKINEVAKLTGVTVRTLHYYDQIGLLKPETITEAGYRLYGKESLATLQQILFFRELEFPLQEIKEIMTNPSFDQKEALRKQKQLLLEKRKRLDSLIDLVEESLEGECTMSFKEFDTSEIENHKKQYAKEVKERWGTTDAYKESEKKTKEYSKEDWDVIQKESADIMKAFAAHKEDPSDSKEVQELVARWQQFITKRYYTCTKEILQGLGLMYTADERFKKNIDQYGDGTAECMARAIAVYCENK